MIKEKQEDFNPPQVSKLPSSSHSWLWFNPQHIKRAGSNNIFIFLFFLSQVFTLSLLCCITTMFLKIEMGDKELFQQDYLVVAL